MGTTERDILHHLAKIKSLLDAHIVSRSQMLAGQRQVDFQHEIQRCAVEYDKQNQSLAYWIDRILKA